MFVVSLIASPTTGLDPSLAGHLRDAMDGGDVLWLGTGEAAEFAVRRYSPPATAMAAELRGLEVDLNILPAKNRKKKLILADMDSTMIGQECIDELAEAAGVGAEVAEITERAMNGELDFAEALVERVALLRGLPVEIIDSVLAERITPAPGGATLVATMKAEGSHAALVSGGFTVFAEAVAAKLGFDEARANVLLSENGRLTGEVAPPILGRGAKVDALEDISARLGIGPEDVLAVGDGANDLGMIERAGLGVAMRAKPVVARKARVSVNHGDLTALLYLQGYRRREFAD